MSNNVKIEEIDNENIKWSAVESSDENSISNYLNCVIYRFLNVFELQILWTWQNARNEAGDINCRVHVTTVLSRPRRLSVVK